MNNTCQSLMLPSILVLCVTHSIAAYAVTSLDIDNASRSYRFSIRLEKECEPPPEGESASCEGPATLTVTRKGKTTPVQSIRLENIFVSFASSSKPLVNSAKLYDYQGVINTGDYNFDGYEDFAVQNGNQGPYGGPSYTVFLYTPRTGGFSESESLSSLTMETLGFFRVNTKGKLLETMSKSGCCYHEFVKYRVIDNEPVAVFRRIEDATSQQGDFVRITEERLVGSKWRKVRDRRISRDKY